MKGVLCTTLVLISSTVILAGEPEAAQALATLQTKWQAILIIETVTDSARSNADLEFQTCQTVLQEILGHIDANFAYNSGNFYNSEGLSNYSSALCLKYETDFYGSQAAQDYLDGHYDASVSQCETAINRANAAASEYFDAATLLIKPRVSTRLHGLTSSERNAIALTVCTASGQKLQLNLAR